MSRKRILLTSVFGPFGVDDAYGRKENILEVLHNQVTREQGVFSMRFHQETYGLYLLAENLCTAAAVLDFPSEARFIREIKKGYDYVGISYIVVNFKKAQRMAQLVRRYAPHSKIILGGHGTSIENTESLVPHDYICRGEGVRFLRELLGEDVSAPIRHPIRYSSYNRYILGLPISNKMVPEGIIMPGVGCVNGCSFCCTSHFFQKEYIPFIETGRDLFDLCCRYEEEMGITDFFVLDENFFKSEQRARDLLALMEENNKAFSFNIFSSAETILKMGLDFIQRIGIDFVWIGVESRKEIFEKNRGVDFLKLIRDLRRQGVSMLVSGILFLEHHTKENIHEDIDFLVDLKSDFLQFMGLGASPPNELYRRFREEGRIIDEFPYEDWHGQRYIWFKHPHFKPEEAADYLKDAFRKDYLENGPSILRMAETMLMGAEATRDAGEEFMRQRHRHRLKNALDFYPAVDVLYANAPTPKARAYAQDVRDRYGKFFGKKTLKVRLISAAMRTAFFKEKLRARLVYNNLRQPPTKYTKYPVKKKLYEKKPYANKLSCEV